MYCCISGDSGSPVLRDFSHALIAARLRMSPIACPAALKRPGQALLRIRPADQLRRDRQRDLRIQEAAQAAQKAAAGSAERPANARRSDRKAPPAIARGYTDLPASHSSPWPDR